MAIPLPIVTGRLLIRPFAVDDDAESMLAVYGDPEVMRLVGGGLRPDLAAVRAELEEYAGAQAERGFSPWAVVERETGRVVGDAGFGVFEPTGDVELGYTLVRDRWGRGYATEAAGACLEAGLAHLAVPRIIAVVDADNGASLRVAERIGMHRTGTIEAQGRLHVLLAADATPASGSS